MKVDCFQWENLLKFINCIRPKYIGNQSSQHYSKYCTEHDFNVWTGVGTEGHPVPFASGLRAVFLKGVQNQKYFLLLSYLFSLFPGLAFFVSFFEP
jgi:hypothetical protein